MAYLKKDTDLGLAISGATLGPGQTRTIPEIAAFCGCSKQNIQQIERRALKKVRNRLLFGTYRGHITAEEIK